MKHITPLQITLLLIVLFCLRVTQLHAGCHADCSFKSGFYLGPYGGAQHVETWHSANRYDEDNFSADFADGKSADCGVVYGACLGYLHHFNDSCFVAGLEAFIEDTSVDTSITDEEFATPNIFRSKQTSSYGGYGRFGFVACSGHMFYGILGGKYTKISQKGTSRDDPAGTFSFSGHHTGLTYGLGYEIEFQGCHRIRFQLTRTRYCEIIADVLPVSTQGGFFDQLDNTSSELIIGYTYAF